MARARIGWLVIACQESKWINRKPAAERWGERAARSCGQGHYMMRRAENYDGLLAFPPLRGWFRREIENHQ